MMARRFSLNPNKSFRENASLVIPVLIANFLSHTNRVAAHPRLKTELHRMRLEGKPLRYAMEVFEPAFGKDFTSFLEEVKRLLDIMGNVHDCDINIPKLQAHLHEVQLYNKIASRAQDKIRTGALTRLIREQHAYRRSLFQEMTGILEQWAHDGFESNLAMTMAIAP